MIVELPVVPIAKRPQNVILIKGSSSAESKISLRSGSAAVKALREAGCNMTEQIIQDDNFDLPADTDIWFIARHGTFGISISDIAKGNCATQRQEDDSAEDANVNSLGVGEGRATT
jgi:hypothetical protein